MIAHLFDVLPPSLVLPAGYRLVSWGDLQRDLLGALGWRPDLLTRLKRDYPVALAGRGAP